MAHRPASLRNFQRRRAHYRTPAPPLRLVGAARPQRRPPLRFATAGTDHDRRRIPIAGLMRTAAWWAQREVQAALERLDELARDLRRSRHHDTTPTIAAATIFEIRVVDGNGRTLYRQRLMSDGTADTFAAR